MKKFGLFAMVALCAFTMFGCGGEVDLYTLVSNNMSEMSDVYFFSDNENLPVSLASGRREEPYVYDGESEAKCDFALIIARLDNSDSEYVSVTIDGETEQVLLEYNYMTGTHVADLERRLTGEEKISISYLDQQANLICKSSEFVVSATQAIEIGASRLSTQIEQLRDGNTLNGECYLKLLDDVSGGFSEVFWLFSVYSNQGEMKNVIISTVSGDVLVGNEQNMV